MRAPRVQLLAATAVCLGWVWGRRRGGALRGDCTLCTAVYGKGGTPYRKVCAQCGWGAACVREAAH